VQLAGQVASLLLLDLEQPAGEGLQAVRAFAQGLVGPLALGDVTVDRIDLHLPAGYRDRHADHRNVQAAAVLAPANALDIQALSVRPQLRVLLLLVARLVGHDQVAKAAAEGLVRAVAKGPCELPVHTDDPIVRPQQGYGLRCLFK